MAKEKENGGYSIKEPTLKKAGAKDGSAYKGESAGVSGLSPRKGGKLDAQAGAKKKNEGCYKDC